MPTTRAESPGRWSLWSGLPPGRAAALPRELGGDTALSRNPRRLGASRRHALRLLAICRCARRHARPAAGDDARERTHRRAESAAGRPHRLRRAFEAARATRVGIVACGYADGYPRHAPTGTPILVDGHRTSTLGRVSMDMLCADLSAIPAARVGTPVTLWGAGLSADEVAAAAGTVSYELLCALAPRVPVTEV